MADLKEYQEKLTQALEARRDWLEKSEIPKLKDEFRTFHTGFSNIYKMLLKKGLLSEDPYKHETKIGEIEVPPTGAFNEAKKKDEMSIRLSNYDNQLDFLVNFYQLGADTLSMDRIKRILGLVKYIDWPHFTPNASDINTKVMVEIVNEVKTPQDQMTASLVGEAMAGLQRSTNAIMGYLKAVADFQKENIKCKIRANITSALSLDSNAAGSKKADAISQIKKKYQAAMGGIPFYPEIVEDVLKEDYSQDGPALREAILKQLAIPETKSKVQKKEIPYKTYLVDGLRAIGSISTTLNDISTKVDENNNLVASLKTGLWDKIKKLMQQVFNQEPEPIIYSLQYVDTVRGTTTKESVNYSQLHQDLERKARSFGSYGFKAGSKLDSMSEEQLLSILDRAIKEAQSSHRILSALDDFFKASADPKIREKIRGIKPELSTIKNAIVNANQRRYEYSAQKEEEEQMKRLGIGS